MASEQKNALLAVILSAIVLFSWQFFMGPTQNKASETSPVATNIETKNETTNDTSSTNVAQDSAQVPSNAVKFTLGNELNSYTFNTNLEFLDGTSKSASDNYLKYFGSSKKFQLQFEVHGAFRNVSFLPSNLTATSVDLTNDNFGLKLHVKVNHKGLLEFILTSVAPTRINFIFSEKAVKLDNGQIKQYVLYDDELSLVEVAEEDKGDKNLNWFGVDFNYHLFSVIFDKPTQSLYSSGVSGDFNVNTSSSAQKYNFSLVYSKKEYDHLLNLGSNLHRSVDFGMMSIVAVPILRGLQFFFTIIPNYGISIILLTILIRMLTFPLQFKSFQSMKKMQVIQPELTKVREKFKDDPQKLQSETMALFKKAGANPLGGCLPLLLQMPIFFAFYRVLFSAVELVGAPFYFWIIDLSQKDPYYVLPILMAIVMFVQQKLTPTQISDPIQQKALLIMPVVFTFFMKDMPAGLTLYIIVSTLVGVLQQMVVFKRT